MVSSTPPPRWQSALVLLGEALGGREHDHTRGSLHRAITLLAIPMVLEMLMESAFALVDVFFVSRARHRRPWPRSA